MGGNQAVVIDVTGPLRVCTADGNSVAPRGAKAQAIIGILALTDDLSRPRRWLEATLWSDRNADQARVSLRQTLSEIRRSLGSASAVLLADRTTVWLNPEKCSVTKPQDSPREQNRELLEGISVSDPAFCNWLATTRRPEHHLNGSVRLADNGLVLRTLNKLKLAPEDEYIRETLAAEINRALSEKMNSWEQSERLGHNMADPDLEISCDISRTESGGHAFVRVAHFKSGRILFSKAISLPSKFETSLQKKSLAKIGTEASERVIQRLANVFPKSRPEAYAATIASQAMDKMFSFRTIPVRDAITDLQRANEIDQKGSFVALEGLAHMFQLIELQATDHAATLGAIHAASKVSIEMEPDNALVHSIGALAQLVSTGEPNRAEEMINTALAINPNCALGWLGRSVALGLHGKTTLAFEASQIARSLANGSRFSHWWETFHCITAITDNRLQDALEAGEKSAVLAPDFRATQRHLIPLYAHFRNEKRAQRSAIRMANLEPGFSLLRLREDPDYPVRSLQKSNLINFPLQVF